MARRNHQAIRCGLIQINGRDAGLVSILEAGILGNTVHGIILDRGPLWFEGYGSANDFKSFLQTFSKTYPKRFGRRIRFIPEIEETPTIKSLLKDYGYKTTSKYGYQTIWLDLKPNLETLRKNLKKKWRNQLNKAEKQNLTITISDTGAYFSWFMQHYTADKAKRKYDGPSPKIITKLAKEFSRGQKMLIATALLEDQPIAAILIFIHGSNATYQIGYTSGAGREKCAHHLLLWNAVIALKERNINDFDLGGINDESAKGVKTFKEGLGGQIYKTPGLYH